MARAMVLSAGLGTRLRPLTLELAKPLVPVGDRPVLAHIADQLAQAELEDFVVNTHHLPQDFFEASSTYFPKARFIHEPEIRGTAGGIAGARGLFDRGAVLVWNGDVLVEPPLDALLASADDGLCLLAAPRPVGEGSVGLAPLDGATASDPSGGAAPRVARVVRLRGERFTERFGKEALAADYVGVCVVGARCLATLPERGCLVGDWALPELRAGRAVHALVRAIEWADTGSLQSYHAANMRWLGRQGRDPRGFFGEGARCVAGARVEGSVVGAGARVEGSGVVRRSVIWPGATARAPLDMAIVTTRGTVVPVAAAPA